MSNNPGKGRSILYNLTYKSSVKMKMQQKLRAESQFPEAGRINRGGHMEKGLSVSVSV